MKRKLSLAVSPDPKSEPPNDNGVSIKWGKKTGEVSLTPMKTYAPNRMARKTEDHENEDKISLKKFTRMQVISCIIQLEEKNFIECPMKGCRCISMSVPEIADHIDTCEGSKSNEKLKLCKYCPHGLLSTKSLLNHIVVSHPYAIEVHVKDCMKYDNSVNDSIRTKFSTSSDFKQTIKNHWRVHLESKGFIMCLIPYCHYVTGFISKMEAHFPLCGPDVWEKLEFSCSKCSGKTFSQEEMDAHYDESHSSDLTYNCGDEKLKEFWELTLQAFEVSKCVTKNCKFIAHNIIALEKHYRYCRIPREENFEVCAMCGGWFDKTHDLWRHETQFHVIGKASKIKKLLSIDVHSPKTSWLMKKLATRSDVHPQRPETPEKLYFKDVVLKKTSFLGELAKTIESESKNNAFVDVRVTVENQFSWALKAPDLNTATEVVTRRLPSYSVKRIMAESVDDGARLLKLSETVSSIAYSSPKTYIPPRPLDFVLDTPNALPRLRKEFVLSKPVVPEVTSCELSVQDKSRAQDVKSTIPALKKKEKSVKGSQKNVNPVIETKKNAKSVKGTRKKADSCPPAKKLKCGDNESRTPNGVKTLLPVRPKALDQVLRNPNPKVYDVKRPPTGSTTPFKKKAATVLESDDANSPAKLILSHEGVPLGSYLFAENVTKSFLRYRCLLNNSSDANARIQSPSAKGAVELSRLASILAQPGGKIQVPSSLKLIRLVPINKLNGAKPITQFVPLQQSSSLVTNPKFKSLNSVERNPPAVEGVNKNSSVGTANVKENSNDSKMSDSLLPFQLPILPPTKSIIFEESNPISDHHGMAFQGSPGNPFRPDNRVQYVRTYGKKSYAIKNPINSLVVENGIIVDKYNTNVGVENGIFGDDMDVDPCGGERTEDPLNVEAIGELMVKTEPTEDTEHGVPSVMFYEDYDIFATAEEKGTACLPPYDATIPFDIICESSQAVSGGLYNDRCPWEQTKTKRSSTRKSNGLPNKNSYRSKKLLDTVCDPHSPSELFGNKVDGSLSVGNLDDPNHNSKVVKAENPEETKELVNYLTNINGAHFVNEPMIHIVDEIIYDNPPKLPNFRTGSKNAECSPDNHRCNLDKPNRFGKVGVAYDTEKFQELVNYLTNFNIAHFSNEPMVYALDRISHDNPPKMSDLKNNRREAMNVSSSSDIPRDQRNSQKASSDQQVGCSDQSALPVDSNKCGGKAPQKTQEAFTSSKRKRKRCSSEISKGLSGEESDKVLSSPGGGNVPSEGGLMVGNPEKVVTGTGAAGSANHEEPPPKRTKNTKNIPCEVSDLEIPVKTEHSEGPTISAEVSGERRKTRKSARNVGCSTIQPNEAGIARGASESLTPKTVYKKRSSRKVLDVHSVEEIAPGVIVPCGSSASEKKLAKRKGRPPKRKSRSVLNGCNVPKSSFEKEIDNPSSTPESILYIPEDNDPGSDVLVPASKRIIFSSPLIYPHRLVECAVCGDTMTAAVYKKEHVIKHNHLCWLKGEEPMDFEDEKGVERFLYRVYLKTRAPFTCEICHVLKKSALGFLTHRKFCGKSVQERKGLMVSCSICSRVLLPSSLHNHMIKSHPATASTPEEPPLDGRQAASKCLNALSTTVKDIRDDQEFIDDSEELKAVEKHSWIRQAYSFCKRRVQKEQKSIIESAAQGNQKFCCAAEGCTFSDMNIINVIEHYRACDKEPLDCRCKECNFMTNSETRMINHVRMTHYGKAKEYASKEYQGCEIIDVSDVAGAFIPYIKSGELGCRSMLYLQPALYWTRDLRAEHLSIDPLFTDWEVAENLAVKAVDEFASYLRLRDESIRIKPDAGTAEWSVLKKLACQSFNDDVGILYTGGVVRTFDWFPSSTSQYLAVSVGSFDSKSISGHPIDSGPGHFQIWSAGTLDNFSEMYEVDLKFYLAICHEFGEIWDLECCPSGAQTDKRLGLVAIGTSSGIVAVYSIPFLGTSTIERAVRLDPVVMLKRGTTESFQVSKISWSKTKPHRFIAAGFTNGSVAVWDLTTTSTLLRSGNTILPFKTFHPHLTIISALSFSPVNEYYIATGCADKSSKFWNLHDTTINHGEFARGLVTDVAWLPHWMAALNTLDDNYTLGTTTVILNSIRNFIYQSQPAVTQPDSTGTSISVNNWLNTFVCGYDSGQIILSVLRKYNQHHNEDRRKVYNCLLTPQLHDFALGSTSKVVGCKSYSSTCERFGIIFNPNFHMNNQTKIKGNPCTDLSCFPLTPVNKVCWNPNPNSFLTLASGFHSGFIIISRVKLPTMETNLLKSIVENFHTQVSS